MKHNTPYIFGGGTPLKKAKLGGGVNPHLPNNDIEMNLGNQNSNEVLNNTKLTDGYPKLFGMYKYGGRLPIKFLGGFGERIGNLFSSNSDTPLFAPSNNPTSGMNFTNSMSTSVTNPVSTNLAIPSSINAGANAIQSANIGITPTDYLSDSLGMSLSDRTRNRDGKFWKGLGNVATDVASSLPVFLNSVDAIKSGIDYEKHKYDLMKLAESDFNTNSAKAMNAMSQMPEAYHTESGINARNVSQDYETARKEIREANARNQEIANRLSSNTSQQVGQALKNQSSRAFSEIADKESQAQSAEKSRVDEVNISLANRNAQVMNQYAKDKATFENQKAQNLTDAMVADKEMEMAAKNQMIELDARERINDLQWASADASTKAYLLNQGLSTLSGLKGAMTGAGSGLKSIKNWFGRYGGNPLSLRKIN